MARHENNRNTGRPYGRNLNRAYSSGDPGRMDRSSITSNRFGFDVGNQYEDQRYLDHDYNLGNGVSMRRDMDTDFDMNGDSRRDRKRQTQRDLSGLSRGRDVNEDIVERHYGRDEDQKRYHFSDDWDRNIDMNGDRNKYETYQRFSGARGDWDHMNDGQRDRDDQSRRADYSGYYGDANSREHLGSNRFGSGRPSHRNENRSLNSDDNFINTQTSSGMNRDFGPHESWQGGGSSHTGSNLSQYYQDRNDRIRGVHGTQRGEFFGKGPKGWRRSDDRIQEDVCEALYHSRAVDASEIEVTVDKGEVYLKGEVDSRHTKREAERCVEELKGVEDVHNQLKIKSQSNVKDMLSDAGKKGRAANLS